MDGLANEIRGLAINRNVKKTSLLFLGDGQIGAVEESVEKKWQKAS